MRLTVAAWVACALSFTTFLGLARGEEPVLPKATIDGVVFMPSALAMTLGVEPSMTATQELVVPRSIPITLLIHFPTFGGIRWP